MRLSAYCDLVYDLVYSHRSLDVELLNIQPLKTRRQAIIEGRVRFWDDSLLCFQEELVERSFVASLIDYVYHYQSADGVLLFRYDNSPHYPNLATFPHHKHVGAGDSEIVEAARPPSLIEVLREIEGLISAEKE